MNRVYIGDTLDLQFLADEDVIDFTFSVSNEDETAYDFTGFTGVTMTLYDHASKSDQKEQFVMSTNLTIPTPANGEIILNIDYSADVDIRPGLYYYKLTYLDASSRPITVALGRAEIVR